MRDMESIGAYKGATVIIYFVLRFSDTAGIRSQFSPHDTKLQTVVDIGGLCCKQFEAT